MTDHAPITLLVVNARIRTGDLRRPWADAAALAGETVVAVGSSAELHKRARADVRTVDAHGADINAADLGRYARSAPDPPV